LATATTAGDALWAVVEGAAVNQDGRTVTLTIRAAVSKRGARAYQKILHRIRLVDSSDEAHLGFFPFRIIVEKHCF